MSVAAWGIEPQVTLTPLELPSGSQAQRSCLLTSLLVSGGSWGWAGITRVVSETTQMFWGKLEWLGHCERRLYQNLKFTWNRHLPKCLVQGQCGQL